MNNDYEDVYVDGGLLCNYPIHAFDGMYLALGHGSQCNGIVLDITWCLRKTLIFFSIKLFAGNSFLSSRKQILAKDIVVIVRRKAGSLLFVRA